MFENAHYRAQVSRNGVLAGLWRKAGAAWQPVVRRSKLYTDKGFEGDKDGTGHRGTLGGWKAAGLPWVQS